MRSQALSMRAQAAQLPAQTLGLPLILFVRVFVPAAPIAFAACYYMEAVNIRVILAAGPLGPTDFPKVLAGAPTAAVAERGLVPAVTPRPPAAFSSFTAIA